jgi:hypothetical protein
MMSCSLVRADENSVYRLLQRWMQHPRMPVRMRMEQRRRKRRMTPWSHGADAKEEQVLIAHVSDASDILHGGKI